MWKLDLRKLNKIIKFFKNLPRLLAEHAFFFSLILVAIAAILGALTFYKYSFLAEKKEPEIKEQPMLLNEKVIQEVLEIRKARQKRFEEAPLREYHNSFQVD